MGKNREVESSEHTDEGLLADQYPRSGAVECVRWHRVGVRSGGGSKTKRLLALAFLCGGVLRGCVLIPCLISTGATGASEACRLALCRRARAI